MNEQQPRELRIKGSSTILEYIRKFSATEKAVFGIFAALLIVSSVSMVARANDYFMTQIPASGGTLHEGLVGLPHAINPILAVTDADKDLSALVYAGLTSFKGTTVIPDIASSWTVSPDGLTYTFTIPAGLKFQNGDPLTADDVIFTIEKIKDPAIKSPHAVDWAGVTATSTSPTTVVFNLRQPYSSFLANTTIGILPRKIWGGVSDDQFVFSEFNTKPVGAGPFIVDSIKRDQGGIPTDYTLKAWSGYHSGKPHISTFTITFFPDIDHAAQALEKGTIDSLSSVPPAIAADLASNKGEPYRVDSTPLSRIFGVFFNQNKNSVLADPIVRKALSMSVDRKSLVNTVLSGYGVPTTGPLPAGIIYNTSNTPVSADIQGAQALLERAGWKESSNGIYTKKASKKTASTTLSFTLYTVDSPDLKQVADILKTTWRTLGADVTIKIFEPTELYQNVIRTRDYDALLFGEALGKSGDLFSFWHSSQRNAPGLNVAMYTNSKADKILDAIRIATSSDQLVTYYQQLNQIISDDTPAVFLYSPELTYVVPKTLQGMNLTPVTTPYDRFNNVSDWYIETEKVWNMFANK